MRTPSPSRISAAAGSRASTRSAFTASTALPAPPFPLLLLRVVGLPLRFNFALGLAVAEARSEFDVAELQGEDGEISSKIVQPPGKQVKGFKGQLEAVIVGHFAWVSLVLGNLQSNRVASPGASGVSLEF